MGKSFSNGLVDTGQLNSQIPFLKSHSALVILLFVSLWCRWGKAGGEALMLFVKVLPAGNLKIPNPEFQDP